MWRIGKRSCFGAAALAAVALVLLLGRAAAAAGDGGEIAWGTVPSPNGGYGPNELRDVAALSATDVWAVGSFGEFIAPEAQIQHWDGTAWTLSQLPVNLPRGELLGIDAAAADDVWAVGGAASNGDSFILHWNGSAWSQVAHPIPYTYQRLYAVDALSANDVWAVGEYSQNGGVAHPLTMHWDGAAWSIVDSPSSPGYDQLNGVAAIAANDVWAVGDSDGRTLILHWNGSLWRRVYSPSPGDNGKLTAVSAVDGNNVWAVGESSSGLLALRYDGNRWRRTVLSTPAGILHDLNDVTAVSSSEVWAVGFYSYGPGWQTLVMRWNGSGWSLSPSPSPDPTLNVFYGVDAVDGQAWAVGRGGGTLVEQWDGDAWSVVPSANGGTGSNELLAIAAVHSADIWAVGNVEGDSLTMHWDGAAWTIVPSPNLEYGIPLQGVAAIASDDVWAVGTHGNNLQFSTITMHWDGAAWSVVPSPNPGGDLIDELHDVDGAATDDVWAVGEYWDANLYPRPMILHWDGSAWSIASHNCDPSTPLLGLSVLAADDIWAVGDSSICHYDGVSWQEVPSPQPQFNEIGYPLHDVDGIPGGNAWAVGARIIDQGKYVVFNALVEVWNGSQWAAIYNVPGTLLYGVEALAANDVWAVGTNSVGTLILHWNGAAWESVPSPDPENGGAVNGIDVDSDGVLWGAGSFYNDDYDLRTLILQAPSTTQGSVVGDTNVAFATVTWIGAVTGTTTTDSFGEYGVAGLPAGSYTFIVSIAGCEPAIAQVNVIAGTTVTRNFSMNC